jgi:hypothetical protein
MRKHPDIIISQVSIPQINLDIGTASLCAVPTLSSVGNTPNHQKYHVDDINEPTPYTQLYVKGKTLRTIEVAHRLFCRRAERMRVLQLLKIPHAAQPDLLLHHKILHKLPILLKIYYLHNLLSIILHSIILLHMVILQSLLLILPLFKIHQLDNLLSNVLLHMFILWSLLTLPSFSKYIN